MCVACVYVYVTCVNSVLANILVYVELVNIMYKFAAPHPNLTSKHKRMIGNNDVRLVILECLSGIGDEDIMCTNFLQ